MILKLLLCAIFLTFYEGDVAATSCHELQQSQLISLTERMNQIIDTISTLFPKSVKKLPSPAPATSAPTVDYTPSIAGHDMSYYFSPPLYSTLPPTPHMMYVPPPYAPIPTAVGSTPSYPNSIGTPLRQYTQVETGHQTEYPFSIAPSFAPQPLQPSYQCEQPPQYANPIPISHLVPPLYQHVPYPTFQPSPMPAPIYPNLPGYAPGLPVFPLPAYPQLTEVPQKYI